MSDYSLHLQNRAFVSAPSNAVYNFGTGDFTVEAWIKPETAGVIISRKSTEGGAPGKGGFLLILKPDGALTLATDNGFGFYLIDTNTTPVLNGNWHHVAGVRQAGLLTIYVDGAAAPSNVTKSLDTPLDVSNSMRLVIGATDQQQQPYNYYTGMLDEVRIWNYARQASDISKAMNSQLSGDEAGLVGYWNWEFGFLADLSATNNAGQLNGQVAFTTPGAPVASAPESPTFLLFGGMYACDVFQNNQWQSTSSLYMTSNDKVVFGNTRLVGVNVSGNSISWLAPGNPHAGNILFKLDSNSSSYWPQGQQSRKLFEGTIQYPGQSPINFRGLYMDRPSPCAFLMSHLSGLVIDGGAATSGTPITLQAMTGSENQHFCLTEDGFIMHMQSQLVLDIYGGSNVPGTQVILFQKKLSDNANQRWTVSANGHIVSVLDPNLVLDIRSTSVGTPLIVSTRQTPSVDSQLWHALNSSQFFYNAATGLVLDISGASPSAGASVVVDTQKTRNTASQRWFFVDGFIVSSSNGMVLSIKDANPNTGASIVVQPMASANNTYQQWTISDGQIISALNGLALDTSGSGAGSSVITATPDSQKASQNWSPQAIPSVPRTSFKRSLLSTTANLITYEITIKTSNSWFAGTDDEVYVSLVGPGRSTKMIELRDSLTHSDPFERGNEDVFRVNLEDVGEIQEIDVQSGHATIFGRSDNWAVDWIRVYDTVHQVIYTFTCNKSNMPYWIGFLKPRITRNNTLLPMGTSMYPSQKGLLTRRIISLDHTWVTVDNTSVGTVYFACAGGYQGDGTTFNTVQVQATINDAVRMATKQNISTTNPLQSVYGYNNSQAIGNCGVQPGEYTHWDGQCHQITNRLLYVGIPLRTLADANPPPHAYGLSCLLFGDYGVGFEQWCAESGFDPPMTTTSQQIAEYIRRAFQITTLESGVYEGIIYAANTLRGSWTNTDQGEPNGSIVAQFVQSLQRLGYSVQQIANATGLANDVVQHDEL